MTTAKKRTAAQKPKSPPRKAARKSTSSPDQYTKPELRDHIKDEVLAGDKGGKAGQWSARKAQLVASEYEREGGAYKHPRNETQQHLHQWTEEHWQTSDGKPAQRGETTTRYLPAKAWEQLSPERKQATNRKKVQGSKEGKQFVANTPDAAAARRSASRAKKQTKHAAPSTKARPASAPKPVKRRATKKATKRRST